jgi:hypothetical protein
MNPKDKACIGVEWIYLVLMAGSFKHYNEPSNSLKYTEFIHQLSDRELLKKYFLPRT